MASSTPKRSRTIWIWLLIVVAFVIGVFNLLDAARLMGWLPIAALGELKFFLPSANWLGAIMYVILALIWFWVARNLYNLDPRGWLFVAAIAVINLIFLFMALFGQTSFQSIMMEVLLNVVALVIAMLPSTKRAFGQ
ncbi:MAG: hypothetical protein DCC51_04670 [Anaerolineae bacterium]|nr:MAG: hypothetical protein DCC51_04670 [Anaerolineae bacterium]